MSFLKSIKPLVWEFNSWCFSTRLSYGDFGDEKSDHPKKSDKVMGFHVGDAGGEEPVEEDDEDGE